MFDTAFFADLPHASQHRDDALAQYLPPRGMSLRLTARSRRLQWQSITIESLRNRMKKAIAVEVGGQALALRSEADESYVRELAEMVEAKLKEVSPKARAATIQSAMLAAMSLADDLIRERGERLALRKRVREKSRRVLELIDREVGR